MMEREGVKALGCEGVRCKGVGLPDLRKYGKSSVEGRRLMIAYSFSNCKFGPPRGLFRQRKKVSAILAFEFTPNQTRINPECSPKVPRRYHEGTTEVLPRNFTLVADALAGAQIVKARRRKGVKAPRNVKAWLR